MSNEKAFSEDSLIQFFVSENESDNIFFCREIPVFARSVDLVIYDKSCTSLTAIEFKLNDWKRALKQLFDVELCFDYLELCIPQPKVDKVREQIINACNDSGVGLYFFDVALRNFRHVLKPQHVQNIWDAQRQSILCYIKEHYDERCLEITAL